MGNTTLLEKQVAPIIGEALAPDGFKSAYDQLSIIERRFVDEYVESENPRGAAIRAYGKRINPGAIDPRALEMVRRPLVQAAIAELSRAATERCQISTDKILREVAKVAFSNIGDYIKITADGEPFVDMSDVDANQLAAVAEVTVEDYKEGRGDDARDVRKVKFKLHDKLAGLDKLMRYAGLYAPDKIEHSGPGGGPIQTANANLNVTVDMSSQDAANEYAKMLE
jgi:phage terminase small subunit